MPEIALNYLSARARAVERDLPYLYRDETIHTACAYECQASLRKIHNRRIIRYEFTTNLTFRSRFSCVSVLRLCFREWGSGGTVATVIYHPGLFLGFRLEPPTPKAKAIYPIRCGFVLNTEVRIVTEMTTETIKL